MVEQEHSSGSCVRRYVENVAANGLLKKGKVRFGQVKKVLKQIVVVPLLKKLHSATFSLLVH